MSASSFHETLAREETIAPPSDRKFGVTMAAVFAVLAAISLYHAGHFTMKNLVLATIALAFLLPALFAPARLHRLNLLWLKFGLLLHCVTNPVIMLLLYLVAIVPMGLIFRLLGKDPLKRAWDREAATYWTPREPGPAPESIRQQF
jgi:hypothetical protein